MVAFERFKAEMEAYVAEYGNALVPTTYMAPSGYPLGRQLSHFRGGVMRMGLPKQDQIEEWAEALPGWAWHAKETDEYKEARRQAQIRNWAEADESARAKWLANIAEANSRPERVEVLRQSGISQWANADEATRAKWIAAIKEGHNRPEVLEASRQRGVQRWADADEETRAKWIAANKEGHSRPDVRKAISERMIARLKRERVDEPEREAKRAAKLSATMNARFEAKLEGKTEEEQRKMKRERVKAQRGNAKKKADLERLRTVLPDAKRSDLSEARRKGLIPPLEADASGASASTD